MMFNAFLHIWRPADRPTQPVSQHMDGKQLLSWIIHEELFLQPSPTQRQLVGIVFNLNDCITIISSGTTFSTEVTRSFGESDTVTEEITRSFFGLFSVTLGHSHTTSYDWTQTDIATQSESTTSEVSQKVRPGMKVSIEQAVGHCGGSTINPPLFRLDIYIGQFI